MSMEYRSWIEVPGLPYSEAPDHERLFEALLELHVELGPVMGWTDDGQATLVVLSTDGKSRASAVDEMEEAVADALRSSGLGHLTPTASVVEAVPANAATATA
jgi:hypothetical protein